MTDLNIDETGLKVRNFINKESCFVIVNLDSIDLNTLLIPHA